MEWHPLPPQSREIKISIHCGFSVTLFHDVHLPIASFQWGEEIIKVVSVRESGIGYWGWATWQQLLLCQWWLHMSPSVQMISALQLHGPRRLCESSDINFDAKAVRIWQHWVLLSHRSSNQIIHHFTVPRQDLGPHQNCTLRTFATVLAVPRHSTHKNHHCEKIDLDTVPYSVKHLSWRLLKTQDLEASSTANMSDAQANEAEKNIEIWKVKKLIKRLEAARGNGTSMISLIIRGYRNLSTWFCTDAESVAPKDQVSRAAKMLAEEYVCLRPLLSFDIILTSP